MIKDRQNEITNWLREIHGIEMRFSTASLCADGGILIYRRIKIAGWIAIGSSAIGVIVFLWFLVGLSLGNNLGVWLLFSLCVLGIIGGVRAIKHKDFAKPLLGIFWAVQIISYHTPSFNFSMNTGVHFYISTSGNGQVIALNLFALGMLIFTMMAFNPNARVESKSGE